MNFTSLRPHLQRQSAPIVTPPPPPITLQPRPVGSAFPELIKSLYASLQEFVLCGSDSAALRERFDSVVANFQKFSETETDSAAAAEISRTVSEIFKDYRDKTDQVQRDHQEALNSLCALLKEALLVLSSRGDRVVDSFSKMETSLKRASEAGSIQDLRAQVGNILQFVQKEGVRERKESERAIASLSQRYTVAQGSSLQGLSRMPDREHALDVIKHYRGTENLWAVLVVVDQFDAIRARYGDPAVMELIQEVAGVKEKVMATQVRPFRWSPDSVLLLVESYRDLAGFKEDLEKAIEPDFEFKLFLGLRLATLNVQLRRVTLAARQPDFVALADQFLGKS